MLLSIIVPVYNMAAEQKLNHCLDSLLEQRISDYEIIAVDDASTDHSLSLLREYEAKYPEKIKVVACKENHRQGGAKNRGLAVATGKWIGFVDSDDWVHPTMYEKLLQKAEETGADLVGCDYTLVDTYTFTPGKNIENNTFSQTGVLDEEKHRQMILQSGSMVVKIYLHKVITDNHLDFPENIFYEDNCAAPLWSCYFTHFERVPEPLYYYLTLPQSTTHQVTWEKCLDRLSAGEALLSGAKERGFYKQYKEAIDFRFTQLYYATTLFSYMYSGKCQKMEHTRYLRKKIREILPDFQTNPNYEKGFGEEDKRFIRLHMKSNFLFFVFYKLLFGYRRLREKKS
ncbi:MAG: glycosyltransferase family 2 protein [Lachnospiraceae bacterium]